MLPALLIYKLCLFWKINIISKEICKSDVRQVHFLTKNRRDPYLTPLSPTRELWQGHAGLWAVFRVEGSALARFSGFFYYLLYLWLAWAIAFCQSAVYIYHDGEWRFALGVGGYLSAGGLRWRSACGFDFARGLWLPLVAPFSVLGGVVIGSCGSYVSFLAESLERVYLLFRGLSYCKASVTLYLWFRF